MIAMADLVAKLESKELSISVDLTSEFYQEMMIQGLPEQIFQRLLRMRLNVSPDKFGTASIRRILKASQLNPLKVQTSDRLLGLQVLQKLYNTIVDAGTNYCATILQSSAAAGFYYSPPNFAMPYEVLRLCKHIQVDYD